MGSKHRKKNQQKKDSPTPTSPSTRPPPPPPLPSPPKKGSFRCLQPPLSQGALDFLDDKGFHTMTPVQEATIPLFLQNKDVAVQAVTGSGKTLAFLLPALERIRQRATASAGGTTHNGNGSGSSSSPLARHQIGVLILSPTRELAMQTWRVCADLCRFMALKPPLLLVGGGNSSGSGNSSSSSSSSGSSNHRPVTEDLKTFQRECNDVLIGTPGRMEDVLTRYSVVDVSELDVLILDEADVLLFGRTVMDPTIARILNRLPKMRRTGIFSATTTFTHNKSVKPLLQRAGMRNPVLVNVQVAAAPATAAAAATPLNPSSTDNQKLPPSSSNTTTSTYTPTSLTNYYLVTKLEEKMSRLVAFLQDHRTEKAIVFFLTCACVDFYGTALQKILNSHNDNSQKNKKKTTTTINNNDNDDDDNDDNDDSIQIEILHGKLVQKRREKAMERFRDSHGGALFCTDVAARGLDVADIDWVIQVDAPQDPSQFVHRVGRSARAGRKGSSLLFLTEKEEAYVDLLSNRKVPLTELPDTDVCCRDVCKDGTEKASSTIPDILPRIRGLVLVNRDLLEKGTKAFTSYIRAYKEHVCGFIFRFASLDLGHLATSFCLLRLPKMPELRDCKGKLKHFSPASPEVNIFAIPYNDKEREGARQRRLASELAAGGKNAKQIKAEKLKAEQVQRIRDRRQAAIDKGRNPEKKRGRNAQLVDEWEELAKEERLFKKMRRGKITKEEYDEQMFGSSLAKSDSMGKKKAAGADASSSDDSDNE